MMYTNAAVILVIASTSLPSSDARAYVFSHMNKTCVRYQPRSDGPLYAGYCVGCSAWKHRFPSIDALRPLDECKFSKTASAEAHDMKIRRVSELPEELPTHMMEMEQYVSPNTSLPDSTDVTDGLRIMEDGNLDEEGHSFVRQLIASILLFGVAATSYLSYNTKKRNKFTIKTPKKGLKITIPTDLPPDLACATPLSIEDDLPDSKEEISTLREENQILQDKLAYYTAKERSYNKSMACNPNVSIGYHHIQSPKVNLHNQIDDLKEELKEKNERLRNAINTNIVLNDAHDRKHNKLKILQDEMEMSWKKFEETYETQHREMQRVEERERKLLRENNDLKSSNRDLALKLNKRTQ